MTESFVRENEIDPKKYYPPDVYRERSVAFPGGFEIDVRQTVRKGRRVANQTHGRTTEPQLIIDKNRGCGASRQGTLATNL